MKRRLNLIPAATQRRHALRRVVRAASRSIVFTGATAAALLGIEWARGLAELRELRELETRHAPVSRLIHEHAALAEQIKKLRAREQVSLRLSHEGYGLAALGAAAIAAGSAEGAVYFEEFTYAGEAGGAGAASAVHSVRIEGAGVDGLAVAQLAERLQHSGVFESVAVSSTSPMSGGSASLRHFTIDCQL